jgi:hypothetical protein
MSGSLETLGYIVYRLGLLGIVGEGIYSTVLISNKTKLNSNDWALNVFTPTIISLFLIGLGSFLIMRESPADYMEMLRWAIPVMVGGSILVSSLAITFSSLIMNWKSD